MKMINLVPQDSAHPLYDDRPEYTRMRHNFLLDSMIQDKIDPTNPKFKESSGLVVKNMNGRDMVFQRKSDGEYF